MDVLQEQIEQARKSAAIVAKQDATRAAAESLPALEARKAALERRDAAHTALDATKAAVRARLAELRQVVQKQHAEIQTTLDALRRLEKEIPSVAGEIRQEQRRLHNAINELEAASRVCGSTLGMNAQHDAWAEVGGLEAGLNSTAGINPKDYFRKLSEVWPSGFTR